MIDGISLESLQALLADNLAAAYRPRFIDVACALGAFYAVLQAIQVTRCRLNTTALLGPPNPSFVWGVGKTLLTSPDSGAQHEKWAEEYGGVYEVASALGGRRIILCDPKAVAHFYGGEPWTYILTPFGKLATENVVGKGILSAKGESHRRQRKTLTPAFSNSAIRNLTSVFYDSAYKAKSVWDSLIDANGGSSAIIEVQNCLDTIGIAGFSHDFGSLDGKPASVTEVFDSFGSTKGKSLNMFLVLLAQALPWLLILPTPHSKLLKRLNDTMGDIANVLLTRSKKEKEAGTLGEREEKSIIGLLSIFTWLWLFQWALIELSKNSDMQTKLRAELLKFGADPTYDQLANNLPYLDAVVHETLRVHAPLPDFLRMASAHDLKGSYVPCSNPFGKQAAEDDVIPLSKPVRTRSGKLVDHISVAKGTHLSVSVSCINRSTALWGPDAKEFKPERWIGEEGIPAAAKEVQGHRHLLTFIDGPRTCLGKGFAIAEFKIVLSILVKNFVFEFPGGPGTVIETARGILPRPKVAGEEGTAVPLRVRRFE
ncbi:cytochrome P450 [Butyriboletus roseoflavus]|nr:cytochrome P450 [Butyriboletus roseoflavus]